MRTLVLAAAVIGTSLSFGVNAAGSADAGQAKAAVCGGCHGVDGNSPLDQWPRLAGQLPQYIAKQLHDFKAGLRKNEQMSPMAQPLSDQDIDDLAAYFAKQKPAAAAPAKSTLRAAGRELYLKGKGRPDVVPACVGCHGPRGDGKADWPTTMSRAPSVLAPAIGTQHSAYTAKQLAAYRAGQRDNDLGHVMRDVAGRLSDADIAALSEYIASLAH